MGTISEEFAQRLAEKSADVGMMIIDVLVLLVLTGALVLADLGREWVFTHVGFGDWITRVVLFGIEILLALSAYVSVLRWLINELKRLAK